MASGELPVLRTRTLRSSLVLPTRTLPKFACVGATCASADACTTPVPLRSTAGEPAAFDESVSVAARAPATAGVNTVLIVQFAPAAREPPTGQLLVCENSLALMPATLSAVSAS